VNTSPHIALGAAACVIGLAVAGAMLSRAVHVARRLSAGEVRTRFGRLTVRERPAAALGYLLVETVVIGVCALIGLQALLWGSGMIFTP
jgi:hypothetical protein